MATAEEILNGDDFFVCQRLHATMKKTLCVEYQGNDYPDANPYHVREKRECCVKCPQGAVIKEQFKGVNVQHRTSNAERRMRRKGENMREIKTKVCSKPNCKHGGEPQDISRFAKHPDSKDGYAGVCYDCKKQQNKDRTEAKKAGTYVSRRGKDRGQRASSCAKAMEDRGKENRLQAIKNAAAKRDAKKAVSPKPVAIVPDAVSSAPVIDMTGNNEIYRTAAAIFVRSIERKFMESVAAELKD